MDINDVVTNLRQQLDQVNGQLADLQAQVAILQAQKQQIESDATDFQNFITWKKANP